MAVGRQVQRHPWLAGGAAVAILVLLAVPFTSLRLAFTDAGTNPPSYTSRQAYDLLANGFGPGANGPLVVALALPGGTGQPGAVTTLRAGWPHSRMWRSSARRSTTRPGTRRCSP